MKKKYKVRKFEKLMHPHYPIGWGTGLTADEWREFADSYVESKEEKNNDKEK